MDPTSTDMEQLADRLSRVNWSELLIGPCLVEHWLSFDGKAEFFNCRWLTGVLTFRVEPGTLPELLAKLLPIASPDPSGTESCGGKDVDDH